MRHVDVYSNEFIGNPESMAQAINDVPWHSEEIVEKWSRYDKGIECIKPIEHARKIKHGVVCSCQLVQGTTVTHKIKIGDASEIDAMFGEFRRIKEENGLFGRTSDDLLCRYQQRAYSMGWTPITLGSNIYGWCFGSTLRSNIGGGRYSMSPRGLSMEEAIRDACSYVSSNNNAVLTLNSWSLPKRTLEILGIPDPTCENPSSYNQNKWLERFGGNR